MDEVVRLEVSSTSTSTGADGALHFCVTFCESGSHNSSSSLRKSSMLLAQRKASIAHLHMAGDLIQQRLKGPQKTVRRQPNGLQMCVCVFRQSLSLTTVAEIRIRRVGFAAVHRVGKSVFRAFSKRVSN
eukprot:2574742-Amphidinium_carterae.2